MAEEHIYVVCDDCLRCYPTGIRADLRTPGVRDNETPCPRCGAQNKWSNAEILSEERGLKKMATQT